MEKTPIIKQMVYISKARPGLKASDVEAILESARGKNQGLDITGFLLFNGKTFVQLLEGPPENVTRLYGQIERDERHSGTQVLLEHRTASRLLSSWAMAYSYMEGPDAGLFGGTMARASVREMATILQTGDSVLRRSIANSLLHLAGLDSHNSKNFFAA